MRTNDILQKTDIRAKLTQAMKDNDTEAFSQAFTQLMEAIAQEVRQDYDQQVQDLKLQVDTQVLSNRGVRQLTTKEKEFYQKFGEAIQSSNPKQALTDLKVVMPETVINAVFDELQTSHPLLSKISFVSTGAAVRLLMNTSGLQMGAWGQLCDEIIQELSAGFKEVDTGLFKFSAFLPLCKSMLELGPEWLDRYVRQVLVEGAANTLEFGFIRGTGKDQPIGMNRQVGDNVTVQGGVYPEKAKIQVTDLSPATLGNLISMLAVDESGKPRTVRDLILVVSPQDYFQKVMPATTVMAPDGTYRNDVLPYPVQIIQSAALENGSAILGIGYKYMATAGSAPEGQIDFSDHYRFLEDQRIYLVKGYANGFPMDNNAFLYLDVTGLRKASYHVVMEDAPAPSGDATLSGLKLGALTLSPAFDSATTSYTATTTNAKNTIVAIPANAGATVEITHEDAEENANEISNGAVATWGSGANTLTIHVTAEDGTTTKDYTVTVTKS